MERDRNEATVRVLRKRARGIKKEVRRLGS